MKLVSASVAAFWVAFAVTGCVPLTFSHDEAIDFDKYQTAYLEVFVTDAAVFYGADNARVYLASELRANSGFKNVVVDSSQAFDVSVSVRLSLVEVVHSTDEGLDVEYDSAARFTVMDAAGRTIDAGSVADSGTYPGEAVEDALDEVALYFLRPYRL